MGSGAEFSSMMPKAPSTSTIPLSAMLEDLKRCNKILPKQEMQKGPRRLRPNVSAAPFP
jgi:hypothetical protein